MRRCFQRLKHVYGHQSNFRKMCAIACQKRLKSPFLIGFKNGLCHLDPIFMPFPKWGLRFLYFKNWRSYKAKCKFNSILYTFCKNGSSDHIHTPNFENRVYFFPQGTKLSAENVFSAIKYGQSTKKCKNVPIFAHFSVPLVKSLSNTKWACSTP